MIVSSLGNIFSTGLKLVRTQKSSNWRKSEIEGVAVLVWWYSAVAAAHDRFGLCTAVGGQVARRKGSAS